MVLIYVDKSELWYWGRVFITVVLLAVLFSSLEVHHGGFGPSALLAAVIVLLVTEFHVVETLKKVAFSIVGSFLGWLLGHELMSELQQHKTGEGYFVQMHIILLPGFEIFVLVILLWLATKLKNKYDIDIGVAAQIQAIVAAALPVVAPDWLAEEFGTKVKALFIAYALTIVASFLPPFWAEVYVNDMVQGYLDTLANIFTELEKSSDLQLAALLPRLQSLIDSKEKENSLSKVMRWELPWRHLRKQYENIGDLSRRCAYTIRSLCDCRTDSQYIQNLNRNPELREIFKEICSESAKALEGLSSSMKNNTTPTDWTRTCVKVMKEETLKLENNTEAKDIMFWLTESVKRISELASSVEELSLLVPFKESSGQPTALEPSQPMLLPLQREGPVKEWVSCSWVLDMEEFKTQLSSEPVGPDPAQSVQMALRTGNDGLGHVAVYIGPPEP